MILGKVTGAVISSQKDSGLQGSKLLIVQTVKLPNLEPTPAYNVAVDRRTIADQLYGAGGQATGNFINSPTRVQSPNTRWEFNLEKAAHYLD